MLASSASSLDPAPVGSAERAVVATVALGTALAPLNSTMLAVALPAIMAEFGSDVATVGWLVTAYLIVMASVQPIAGKLGDRPRAGSEAILGSARQLPVVR